MVGNMENDRYDRPVYGYSYKPRRGAEQESKSNKISWKRGREASEACIRTPSSNVRWQKNEYFQTTWAIHENNAYYTTVCQFLTFHVVNDGEVLLVLAVIEALPLELIVLGPCSTSNSTRLQIGTPETTTSTLHSDTGFTPAMPLL